MFSLHEETHASTMILHLSGEIVLPHTVSFDTEISKYFQTPRIKQYVLDLEKVSKMDRAGLGVLINASTKLQRHGSRLVFLSPSPTVAQLLYDTETEGFFPTCDSLAEIDGYLATQKA